MGQAFAGQHHVLRLQPGGQPCGAENHAVNDPGLGHPPSNADDAGRHRPADQSALTGLDRILRAIRALGAAPCAPTRQPDASGLGEAEVQAICCSQDPRESLSPKHRKEQRRTLRALADREDRHVCLMGAECGESLTLGSARGWRCNSVGLLTPISAVGHGAAGFCSFGGPDATVNGPDSGRAALAILERGEPWDLMLVDLMVSGLSGADTVRSRRTRPALKVLFITGYA